MHSELSLGKSHVIERDFGSVTHLEVPGLTQSSTVFASLVCTIACF